MSDAAELRRQIIERARQAREQAASDSTSSSESSSSSSSEDSSSSEEEGFKPVFVPKHSRVTEIERAKKETEAHEAQRMFDLENEQYLEQQRERAVADATRNDVDMEDSVEDKLRPPPIGDEDTEEAYQMWRIRELKRIMRFRGIQMDEEEPETEETNTGTIKGAFYRDIIAKDKLGEKIDSSSVPEREQIASATNRMKSTLFKQVSESVEEDKSVPPKPPSAALTERLRIAQKFTKRSGGMKDL